MAASSVEQVAKLLNLTPRRVQQLVKDGMPQEARGQYDALKCMMWYIRYLQDKVTAREAEDGPSLSSERLRGERAKSDLLEMERDEKRGRLQDSAAVVKVYATRVMSARTRMLAIPTKVAPMLLGAKDTTTIEATIKSEIHAALRELANHERTATTGDDSATAGNGGGEPVDGAEAGGDPEGGRAVPAVDRPAVEPAAGVDGQPVG